MPQRVALHPRGGSTCRRKIGITVVDSEEIFRLPETLKWRRGAIAEYLGRDNDTLGSIM